MSLAIKIVKDPTGTSLTKYLKCETYSFGYSRKVSTLVLPGNTVAQFDLGISKPMLRLMGVADNSTADTGDGGIANYSEISDMNTWYTKTIYLYISSTEYFNGKIAKLDLEKMSGQDYYKWSMEFEYTARVVS